jgi:hypothetical protein
MDLGVATVDHPGPAAQKLLVVITSQKLEIKDKVYFATGKATQTGRDTRDSGNQS